MSTHAGIGYRLPNGKIEAVYCHFDGYLEHVGKILYKNYNSTRVIKQIVAYGDFSSLEVQPSEIEFYNDNGSQSQTYTAEDFSYEFEYSYVWVSSIRKWFVACRQTNHEFVPLGDALRNKFDRVVDIGSLVGEVKPKTPKTPAMNPQVSGGMNPSTQEVEDFFTGASTMINRKRRITAAEDEEFEDPRIDEADELQTRVEDDFDYVMTGIERLGREGLLDEALELLHTLADTLDSAINIIGNDFESGEEIPPEEEL